MGTINYRSSDIITVGVRPYDYDDMKKAYIEFLQEDTGDTINPDCVSDSAVYDYISDIYNIDFENAEFYLNELNLYHYSVDIKSGYYDGLYIDITDPGYLFFDDSSERQEVRDELKAIKNFLINCVNCGWCVCYPGWCTGYCDYNNSIKAIQEAYEKALDTINHTSVQED